MSIAVGTDGKDEQRQWIMKTAKRKLTMKKQIALSTLVPGYLS
jgi:hypothetical protein